MLVRFVPSFNLTIFPTRYSLFLSVCLSILPKLSDGHSDFDKFWQIRSFFFFLNFGPFLFILFWIFSQKLKIFGPYFAWCLRVVLNMSLFSHLHAHIHVSWEKIPRVISRDPCMIHITDMTLISSISILYLGRYIIMYVRVLENLAHQFQYQLGRVRNSTSTTHVAVSYSLRPD
jgi:hypothetical protein